MQRACTFILFLSILKGSEASFHRAQPSLRVNPTAKAVVAAPHDLVVRAVQPWKTPNSTKVSVAQSPKPAALVQTKNLKTWIVNNNRLWKVSCDTHIKKHPDDISCPGNCPFLRAEPTRLCQFKCVPASSCSSDNPLASFANPRSMMCEACRVAGCHQCGETRHDCAICHEGFVLQNGTCLSTTRYFWHTVFTLAGFAVAFVLYYIFALFFLREESNAGALKAGLQFRALAATRNVKKDRQYKLFVNLQKKLINGAGVMLHFRWQGAIMVWAIFGMLLFSLAGLLFWERLGVMHRPNSRKSYDACEENVANQVDEFNNMEMIYFICVTILYLVTFLGSLGFAILQRKFYHAQDHENTTMKDFALLCEGFPIGEGGEKVEDNRLKFFKSQPQFKGLDVVGVSVCWDFREQEDEVFEQVRREFDIYGSEHCAVYAAETAKAEDAAKVENKRSCGFDPQMRSVDALFGIGNFPCVRAGDAEKPEAHEVKELLDGLKTSGKLYVVFGSTKDRSDAFERCQHDSLFFTNNGGDTKEIKLSETDCEPNTVIWKGFGTDRWRFLLSLVIGCSVVFVCVLILDFVFYAPYVIYILSYSDVPGMSQGGAISGLLLGLLITVCNQIIFTLIGVVADKCGWTNSDSKDCFYCVKYTLAVFFNTCLDLATVLILAQGYSVDQAMKMQVAQDSTLSTKTVAESPNMQKALYVQLVAYIFPSCTLLPFLIEPIGTAVVPYFVGKALVRSRAEVTVQDAEECLMNPPYDLSRYGDILVNMMLCCMTMVFTYSDLYQLFLFMLISLLVIYVWDQCRVLRFSTNTVFATNTMDDAIHYMMALPCGVLSMCLCFKAYAASHGEGFLDDLSTNFDGKVGFTPDRFNIIGFLLLAFCGHCIIHWMLLKYVVLPRTDQKDEDEDFEGDLTYLQLASEKPANYFNTNPVNCLRSKYVYKHNPPCIFYKIGKEHLIKENAEIGIHFQGKVHVDEAIEDDENADDDLKTKSLKLGRHVTADFAKFTGGD